VSVQLARAGAEDLPAIAALSSRCFEHGAWDEPALAAELARPFAEVWLAREPGGGQVVGYAVAWFVGDDGELLTVGTEPSLRRRGIGRALVEVLQRSTRQRGVRSLTLEVRADNLAAQHLYEALGFELLDVRRRYYADGTDARIMRWTP
jgi:ribosomal-protein-alanine acetyltransferase